MEKTLLHCYAIIVTVIALCLIGTVIQNTGGNATIPTEQSAIIPYSHGAKLSFAVAEVEARQNNRNLWKSIEK